MAIQTLNIGVVQFARHHHDVVGNVNNMLEQLASFQTVDMVLLPEDWMGAAAVEHEYFLEVVARLQEVATQGKFCLLTGAQYVHDKGLIHSRGAVLHPTEGILGWVEKLFPSGAVGEREFLQPGEKVEIFEYRGVKFGIVICVDLMYPELVRHLALKGAELIFNPASVAHRRSDLWVKVGSTRAAENTVFVVMANNTQTSYPDGSPVLGESFVAGPDGTLLAAWEQSAGCFQTTIDPAQIKQQRKRWPYLADVQRDQKKIFQRFYT